MTDTVGTAYSRSGSSPPIHHGMYPRWLRQALKNLPHNSLGYREYGRATWLRVGVGGLTPHWLDHYGWYRAYDGCEVFISEPYDLDTEKIEAALAFAQEVGAEIEIEPVSAHYPGRTVRIAFYLANLGVNGTSHRHSDPDMFPLGAVR